MIPCLRRCRFTEVIRPTSLSQNHRVNADRTIARLPPALMEKGFRLSVVKVENLGVGTGFEPVTSRLNVWCSTFELSELGRHVEPVHGTTAANLLKA